MSHTGDVLAKAVPIVDGGKPMPLALVTDDTNPATGEFRRLLERHGVEADRVLTLARAFEDTRRRARHPRMRGARRRPGPVRPDSAAPAQGQPAAGSASGTATTSKSSAV